MSLFNAAAQAAQATPLPSPQVVKQTLQTIIEQVPQTPEVVLQLVQMAALAFGAFLVSTFHQVVEAITTRAKEGGWDGNLNRVLATLYSVGLGLFTAVQTGQLHMDAQGAALSVTSIAIALAGTFWGYELRQFFLKALGFAKNSPEAAKNLDLATEEPAAETAV